MKERPVIFSGESVRAILAGRKTQTRRVVQWPVLGPSDGAKRRVYGASDADALNEALVYEGPHVHSRASSPYGRGGWRLWVRETFALENTSEYEHYVEPEPREGPERWLETEGGSTYRLIPRYRATAPDTLLVAPDGDPDDGMKWRPSIFMPRWASRLTLEVTGVRVERLQSITVEDIHAEGIVHPFYPVGSVGGNFGLRQCAFPEGWDAINGKRPGCAWDDDPWVWVVSFRPVETE